MCPIYPDVLLSVKKMDEVHKLITEAIKFHIEGLRFAAEDVPKPTSKSPVYKTTDETSAYIETHIPL